MTGETKYLSIIPARGGSKGIKRKNMKLFNGRPLLQKCIEESIYSKSVSRTIVSSEDDEILEFAKCQGAETLIRPSELALDRTTSEEVLQHVLSSLDEHSINEIRGVIFLQCTSPLLQASDIDAASQLFEEGRYDSLFSGYRDHLFQWIASGSDQVSPLNHDSQRRLTRQDLPDTFIENGAIYIFRPREFLLSGSRHFGRQGIYLMPKIRSVDIDTQDDWFLAERLESILALKDGYL